MSRSDARHPGRRCGLLVAGAMLAGAATLAGASDLLATVASSSGQPLAGAVVTAFPLDGSPPPPARPPQAVMDQIDKEFVPHVLAVPAGTDVQFPNHDDIQHHVYSFSPAKTFELPLYHGTPARPVRFDTPGVVTLGCNIHDWMIGYVYVSATPWFAQTGEDGEARLELGPGRWRVQAWHPRMRGPEEATAREITAYASGAVTRTWRLDLEPDLLGRRAPVGGRRDY